MLQLGDQARGNLTHVKPILFAEQYIATPQIHSTLRGAARSIFCPRFSGGEGTGERRSSLRAAHQSLAREIARCRIGLALSSGGAKGLAHIGVIQVLEENGIEVDLHRRREHGRVRRGDLGLRLRRRDARKSGARK